MITLQLYNKYEKKLNRHLSAYSYVSIDIILLAFAIYIEYGRWGMSNVFLSRAALFIIICVAGSLIIPILQMIVSTKKAVLDDEKITVHRLIGVQRSIKIDQIYEIRIFEISNIYVKLKKNRGMYYGVYFKLRNGKSVMVSENLHITTLLEFLNKFLELYEDKLPPECVETIKEFIKEKGSLIRKEGD